MHAPLLVVDTETTGIPGKTAPSLLRVVEIGAVVITPNGEVLEGTSGRIFLSAHIRENPDCQKALRISGLSGRDGASEPLVTGRFASWVQDVMRRFHVSQITAFNTPFDLDGFLTKAPWSLQEVPNLFRAPCIMRSAAAWMRSHGAGPVNDKGVSKNPKLVEAVAFATEIAGTLPMKPPKLPTQTHRALDDAWAAAVVAQVMRRDTQQDTWGEATAL